MRPSLRPLRSLRVRVPVTAILVFAISLAVATLLAFQLLLQAGRSDVDVVHDRERDRFARSMQQLLDEQDADGAGLDLLQLEQAAERYLRLNPPNDAYWTIIRLDGLPRPLASTQRPETLATFGPDDLPSGEANSRRTLTTIAGDVRSSTAPILLGGEVVGSFQIVSPIEPIRQEAIGAAGLVAAAAGVSLLLGALLLTVTLWRSLSPLRDLASTARSTELRALDARVDEPTSDDEVGLLAREFNLMLDRLERASASQTEFMASVGHELRTPLTIARGHLEMLRSVDRDDPVALAATVEVLEDELGRMGRLVEDLMAIARSDMDGFARPRDLELVAFFEDLELKIAGLRIPGVRIDPPPPIELHVDPDRLAQAVLNLVVNAHQHTPEGTQVRISATVRTDRATIAVVDDGPGIPAAIRDQVFAPFVRAGEVPSSTGLGLAVVQAVVAAHGGEVTLTTDERGSRFELHLPRPVPGDADQPPLTANAADA